MSVSFDDLIRNTEKQLDTEFIDEFIFHVDSSLTKSRSDVKSDFQLATEQVEDKCYMLDEVKKLANELSILALYKKIEIHTRDAVNHHILSIDQRKLSNINDLKSSLPFVLESVDEYSAFNELRLLNNSIKHNGEVSEKLSKNFQSWKKGEELYDLDKAYNRLKPKVKIYIESLVSLILKSKKK